MSIQDSEETARRKALIRKYLENNCTATELAEVFSLFRDPAERASLDSLTEAVWKEMDTGFTLRTEHAEQLKADITNRIRSSMASASPVLPTKRSTLSYRHWGKIAASFIFLSVFAASFYILRNQGRRKSAIAYKHVEAAYGTKIRFGLPDGSIIYLKAGSRLTYPETFHDTLRSVTLEGEAFFEVARDTARPFVIHTGKITTTVLGTSFLVRSFSDAPVEVSVATGKVKVADSRNHQAVITPNEQARYNNTDHEFSVQTVAVDQLIRWKDGYLTLDGTLREALNMLQRWYGVQITLENPRMANCLIKATYKQEHIRNVLTSVCYLLDASFEQQGNTYIIKGTGCN